MNPLSWMHGLMADNSFYHPLKQTNTTGSYALGNQNQFGIKGYIWIYSAKLPT